MDEIIKKILIQNKLYEENKKIINNHNKLDEFLNTYKFNLESKHKIPKDTTRDNEGRIILDEIPFIVSNKEEFLSDNKWIILNNGTKLYLKDKRTKEENILELLIMYFLKNLNISHANYDLATFKDKEYLVTPSFLKNNERIIFLFEKLDKIPKIDEAYQMLKKFNNDTFFLKTCFIDRIIGNADRFPFNYGLITGDSVNNKAKQPKNCPLFDNVDKNNIFIRDDEYYRFPYLTNKKDSSCNKVISHLLDYDEIMNFASNTLKKANLYKAAKELLKEKGIYTDKNTYQKAQKFFIDSETIINDELKNKGKSFKIRLT